MSEYLANNITTTLVNSISASATTIVVASADGFPVPNFRILIDNELMLVTSKSGTSFVVTRGVEGTTATSHSRTTLVSQILTVQGLTNFIQQNVLLSDNLINVNPSGAVTSIAAAAASITDSSSTNRYVIKVSPGIYTEPVITLPEYVFVVGDHIDSVVVEPDDTDHHVFVLSNRSGLMNVSIDGAGSGYAGVYSYDVGNFCLLHKVSITNCDYGVRHISNTIDSYLFLEYVDFTDCDKVIYTTNTGSYVANLQAENLYFEYSTANSANAVTVDGDQANVKIFLSNCIGVDRVGNAFLVKNGGKLICTSSRIRGFNRGFYADTTAGSPYLNLSDISFGIIDYNNINIEIANANASGSFTGYSEYSKTIINKSNDFFVSNKDERTIVVAQKGGDFSSIKDAVDAISDNSYDNRYNIVVGPGIYVEDTITMKDYVSISGEETRSTIVQLKTSPSTNNLFVLPSTVNATIRKLLLRNDISSGATIRYHGGVSHLEQVRFGTQYDVSTGGVAIDASGVSGAVQNSLTMTNCSTARVCNIPLLMKFSDDGIHAFDVTINCMTTADTDGGFENIAEVGIVTGGSRGTHTEVQFVGCTFLGDGTGCAIKMGDGSDVHLMACTIADFDVGFHAVNQGDGPEIEAIGNLIYDSTTYDFWIEHVSANGAIGITSDRQKTSINDTATVAVILQDNNDGSLTVTGDYYQGETFSSSTNLTPMITKTGPSGYISGGTVSSVSGLIVSVLAGTGYIYTSEPPTGIVQYLTWNTGQITLPDDSSSFIYINSSGTITSGTATPSFYTTIVLARVTTDGGNVILIQNTGRRTTAIDTRLDKFLRYYMGAVYRSGSIATASNRAINVTGGSYAYSTWEFSPVGGSPITFSTWYRDGSGWYVITDSQTNVPNVQYDTGTGLADLIDTHYVKHLLLVFGGLGSDPEQYFLVYGQEDFDSAAAAEDGALPSIPDPLTFAVTTVASIIIQKNAAAIYEVLDERPTLVVKTGTGTTAGSDHLALSNLVNGDSGHSQFMMLDGSTPMTDELDMDGNNIISVGTVDGVDISSHVSRHIPGGSDALTTAAPNTNLSVSSTNTAGVLTTLSRSDHTHAITTASANTVSTIVARDASGNFSAGTITAAITGDVTGNVSGSAASFTGSLVGDVTGTQGATVVSTVGTSSAANIHTAELLANAATDTNTANAIVRRSSGNFSAGTITANLTGAVTGNVTGNVSGSAASFTGSLVGDVTGTQGATVVSTVGTSSAANVHNAELLANAATNINTASTIVKRDSSGNFIAGTITANLTGSAASFTGSLIGDVTGTQGATVVSTVGTSSAANVHAAELLANAATNANTASAIVKRDASGNFTAGTITATLSGNATNVSGIVAIANGGTNSSTALSNNRIIISSGGKIVETSAITASRALASDASGLPVASSATATELGYLSGVSGAIQTQINDKASTASLTGHTGNTSNPHTTTLEQARTANNQISGNIDADGYTITGLPDPSDPGDACNKNYADATASGLSVKDPCRVATTIALTVNYVGTPDFTLTSTTNEAIVIDTVTLSLTNRVLVKDQADQKQNGIYTVTDTGTNDPGGTPWELTRATDFDASAEITNGSFALVTGGSANLGKGYVLTTTPPITLDSSNLTWSQFTQVNNITPGSGLALNGTAFDVQIDDSTIGISANELYVKNSGIGNTQLDKANISLSGFGVPTGDLSMGTQKITNLAAPGANADAARKIDVDTVQSNLTGHIGTGGASHAQVTTAVDGFMIAADKLKLNSATNANTVSTIVQRDSSGNFSAGTITATLTGNVSGSSASFTGSLVGDVTGTQGATVVSTVGTSSAANVNAAELLANAATNLNTASTIVKRDGSGNFTAGTITAALTGNASGSAASFTGSLVGDVTGTQGATVVSTVGTSSAANVHAAELLANAATNLNTASAIVKRDSSGNFTAGTITAALTGSVTGNVSGSAASFTGSLVGDVTGTQGATVVSTVGTSSAANVHAAELLANAATNANTASAIVKRDASGNFSAGTITAAISGNVTGNLTGNVTGNVSGTAGSFTGSLVGDVTGTQGATVVSTVGTSSAANVHAAELLANAATNLNTASAIVKRDASGNFSAGTITANFTGTLTGNASNVSGVVAIANGGTNSSTALTNNKIMISSGGKIVESTIGSALCYGHMYANNVSQSVTISVSGTMYRVPGSLTGGTVSNITFQNSRELLVANAGTYIIQWALSAVGGGNNEIMSGSFMINNNGTGGVGASLLAANQATSTTSARPVCISGSAVVSLSANDVIALCVTNRTNTDAVVVSYANLTIHKLD